MSCLLEETTAWAGSVTNVNMSTLQHVTYSTNFAGLFCSVARSFNQASCFSQSERSIDTVCVVINYNATPKTNKQAVGQTFFSFLHCTLFALLFIYIFIYLLSQNSLWLMLSVFICDAKIKCILSYLILS